MKKKTLDGEQSNVHAAFERAHLNTPNHPFILIPSMCPGGPLRLTYGEASSAVNDLIAAYRAAGYGPGHHIALLMESRVEFYLHWLALNAIGATLVPIGADLVEAEVKALLLHGDVDLLICTSSRPGLEQQFAGAAPGLQVVGLQAVGLESARARLPSAAAPRSPVRTADIAAIVFTSGSTGRPKGCMLSNEYFLSFGRWYRDLGGRCALRPGVERLITPLPPNHVNALAFSSMGAIMTGGCIVQIDRFRSTDWWDAVRESEATVMHYLGVMPGMLLNLPSEAKEREHHLRFGIGGGVRPSDHQRFEERFQVPLIEAWAMTETGGTGTIATNVGPRNIGTGCIGRPSPAFSEALVVDDSGNPLPADTVGELVVRAPGPQPRHGFFSGYYRDEEATASAWRDGWLHTGDLARQDEEGSLFFVARRKQVIRRSGENISAAEVEIALATIDSILQVAVVPVADPVREEEVFACIAADPKLAPSQEAAEAILANAAKQMSYFKLPGYIAFVAGLPMTPTQKFRYGAIGEMAATLLAAGGPNLFDVRKAKRTYRAR